MKLKDYLKQNDESKASFAKRTGIPYATVWRIYNEKFTPQLQTALIVQKETGGLVAVDDLILN